MKIAYTALLMGLITSNCNADAVRIPRFGLWPHSGRTDESNFNEPSESRRATDQNHLPFVPNEPHESHITDESNLPFVSSEPCESRDTNGCDHANAVDAHDVIENNDDIDEVTALLEQVKDIPIQAPEQDSWKITAWFKYWARRLGLPLIDTSVGKFFLKAYRAIYEKLS